MRTLSWCWILVLALGCEPPESLGTAPAGADAVASFADGVIGFAEIEEAFSEARTPACVAARGTRGGGSIEELMPCYREVAEDLVLERLVLAQEDDVEKALRALAVYPELRRHAYLEAFNRRLSEDIEIEIADSAVEAYYEANRESYRRPGNLSLWNIFRRHRNPAKPEETLELLRALKRRYEAGETFTAQNVRAIRPSDGLLPKHLPEVLGRRARVAIRRGTPLAWKLMEGASER